MFKLTIHTTNAAFEDDPGLEVARILEELSTQLAYSGTSAYGAVYDINGNGVGTYVLMPDEEETEEN